MKRISVKLAGSTTEPFTIHVTPGQTAGEVLVQASNPTTFFHSEEDLYAAVENNTKLIVLSTYDAARITFKKLFPFTRSFLEGTK